MVNYVYIATSLDGFIAKEDGNTDWLKEFLKQDQSDYGYSEFMSGIDAIIMGRNTFEVILTYDFWPYDKPEYVLSNSLVRVPEDIAGKAEIIKGDIKRNVGKLKNRGYQNLYIDGGRAIQSFLEEDLIDELIILQVPILLGNGIPLFGKLKDSLKFKLDKTESFNDTLIKCYYIRIRE